MNSKIMPITQVGQIKICHRDDMMDKAVVAQNLHNNIFFDGVPEYKPRPDHVIMDVGAHIGAFSVLAAFKIPQGKVYAVEPFGDSVKYLRKNVELNGLNNVVVDQLALSDSQGTARLYYSLEHGSLGHSISCQVSSQYQEVATDTLEAYVKRREIEKVDFMKMNCEGAEFSVILSTPKWVLDRFNLILVLYHLRLVSGYTQQDLIAKLEACGFTTDVRRTNADGGWIVAQKRT